MMDADDRAWSGDFRSAAALAAIVWAFGHSLDFLFQLAAGLPAVEILRSDLPLIAAQYLLSLLLFPIVAWSERLPPFVRWSTIAAGVTVVAGAMVGTVLVNMISHDRLPLETLTDPDRLRTWLGRSMIVPIYIYICGFLAAVMIFGRYGRQMAEQRTRLLRAEAGAAEARFLALRLQVNPHFLFNALNAVSSLILSRRSEEAEEAVARLTQFLRTTLTSDPVISVTLEDELAATEAYLHIEAVRFPDRLLIEVNCPDELLGASVPSLILQPLVENAVKYGVSASSDPTTVTITGCREDEVLCLTVSDDAVPLPGDQPQPGTGIGLANVRQRLAMLYGTAANLTTGPQPRGYRATIRLPYADHLELV
jgi:signal transduction histidine kinase